MSLVCVMLPPWQFSEGSLGWCSYLGFCLLTHVRLKFELLCHSDLISWLGYCALLWV